MTARKLVPSLLHIIFPALLDQIDPLLYLPLSDLALQAPLRRSLSNRRLFREWHYASGTLVNVNFELICRDFASKATGQLRPHVVL